MGTRLLLAVFLVCIVFPSFASGQEQISNNSHVRLVGKVDKVDRSSTTIYVSYEDLHRKVVYTESTRFTVMNKRGSLDAVHEGSKVICRGKFDEENRLIASRIEVREGEQ